MNILVTGGAGFIGGHLMIKLLEMGYRVISLDSRNSNRDDDPVHSRGLVDENKFTRLDIDIRDRQKMLAVLTELPIQIVVHLAARTGVRTSDNEAQEFFDVNINGTINVLDAVKKIKDIGKFVYISSSAVYDDSSDKNFSEDSTKLDPKSPYALSKLCGEIISKYYALSYGIPTVCLRPFTAYGPGQRTDMAISKFMDAISNDLPIPVYGDGTSKRDYTYIDDIVDGIMLGMCHDTRDAKFDVFNIGTAKATSLSKLITIIQRCMGKISEVKYFQSKKSDDIYSCADLAKAETKIGYKPSVELEEGIRRSVEWYRKKHR